MPIRVAIYCRVSTETEIQQHSLGVQKAYYENYIRAHENFVLAGMYIETASGVSIKKRKQFKTMMRACRKKKIGIRATCMLPSLQASHLRRDLQHLLFPLQV